MVYKDIQGVLEFTGYTRGNGVDDSIQGYTRVYKVYRMY